MRETNRASVHFFTISVLLVACHYLLFSQFFPNQSGGLGHDYSLFLPALLDGAFWQERNGLFSLQWFTPAFCGGLPKLANPNAAYLSVPQFLSYFFSPLNSVKLTLFIFGALGFAGMYQLLRKVFCCDRFTALLGAALFLFNGMYAHRMLIGHLTYHAFMLVPFISYLIIDAGFRRRSLSLYSWFFRLLVAALFIAYMVFSGMINLVIPSMLAILALSFIALLACNRLNAIEETALAFAVASIAAIILSGFQLAATLSYLAQFPRDLYPLPGIPNVFDIFHVIFRSLFIEPAYELQEQSRVNARWAVERHELENGVTIIPLVLVLFYPIYSVAVYVKRTFTRSHLQENKSNTSPNFGVKKFSTPIFMAPMFGSASGVVLFMALLGVLALPVVLMYYTPEWNAFLKSLPIVGSSSTLVRWYALYIPVTILLGCLALKKIHLPDWFRFATVFVLVAYILVSNLLTDRDYYHGQKYGAGHIESMYERLKNGEAEPEIHRVSGHDIGVQSSSLRCYEPIFGYLLESYPIKYLREGKPLDNLGGYMNMKNPACYQYPGANACEPGDHFPISQYEEAKKFIRYEPISYKVSVFQRIANYLSALGFVSALCFIVVTVLYLIRQRFKSLVIENEEL